MLTNRAYAITVTSFPFFRSPSKILFPQHYTDFAITELCVLLSGRRLHGGRGPWLSVTAGIECRTVHTRPPDSPPESLDPTAGSTDSSVSSGPIRSDNSDWRPPPALARRSRSRQRGSPRGRGGPDGRGAQAADASSCRRPGAPS